MDPRYPIERHVFAPSSFPSLVIWTAVDPRRKNTRGFVTIQSELDMSAFHTPSKYFVLVIHTNALIGHAFWGGDCRIASVFDCNATVEPNPAKTLAQTEDPTLSYVWWSWYSLLRANLTFFAFGLLGSHKLASLSSKSVHPPRGGIGALLKRSARARLVRMPSMKISIKVCTPAMLYRSTHPAWFSSNCLASFASCAGSVTGSHSKDGVHSAASAAEEEEALTAASSRSHLHTVQS